MGFYHALRATELSHEQSMEKLLTRILASPAFLYRLENVPESSSAEWVTNYEMATRLSFFLWSSLPDAKLREIADQKQLQSLKVLQQQAQRMLGSSKMRRLAEQFACQWLHLRGFDQNSAKNEQLYPEFSDLRWAMYEEVVRFWIDMFQNNRSILDVIQSDHSFLNRELARHYGLEQPLGDTWTRSAGMKAAGRGGVLGMASVLASQSGASQSSPILRGNWVFETLLGQGLPNPPVGVPTLPEKPPQGMTTRQLIEQHSSNAGCARCHAKIDPFGFALEQFDAVGQSREDAVNTISRLEDGTQIEGLAGLQEYLMNEKRDLFVRQFCRKLLGFALGRELQLSDELLVDEMISALEQNEYRCHAAIMCIIASEPFRKIRGTEFGAKQ